MPAAHPSFSESDLATVLVDEASIATRVSELGQALNELYREQDVTVVCVLSGALVFTADLLRKLRFPIRLDCVRAESYGAATSAQKPPRITNPLKTDIAGRHVLVVDDILDSGRTLRSIKAYLRQAKPTSLRTCVLLDKTERRVVDVQADFVGFTIPNEFVVGYGLDFAERYRGLSCIGVLKSEFQNASIA